MAEASCFYRKYGIFFVIVVLPLTGTTSTVPKG
jgi:hypothetical protein